jgi:hypothetical protein
MPLLDEHEISCRARGHFEVTRNPLATANRDTPLVCHGKLSWQSAVPPPHYCSWGKRRSGRRWALLKFWGNLCWPQQRTAGRRAIYLTAQPQRCSLVLITRRDCARSLAKPSRKAPGRDLARPYQTSVGAMQHMLHLPRGEPTIRIGHDPHDRILRRVNSTLTRVYTW